MPQVSDNFNRADGGLGSNWTPIVAGQGASIVGNRVESVNGLFKGNYWSADTFSDDQFIRYKLSGLMGNVDNAIFNYLRYTDQDNCYIAATTQSKTRINRIQGGSASLLGEILTDMDDNSILEHRIVGNTISLYKNGSHIGDLVDTDTPFSGGLIGFRVVSDTVKCYLDDFEAGNYPVPSGDVLMGTQQLSIPNDGLIRVFGRNL